MERALRGFALFHQAHIDPLAGLADFRDVDLVADAQAIAEQPGGRRGGER